MENEKVQILPVRLFSWSMILLILAVFCLNSQAQVTKETVIALVDQTAKDISVDATGTLEKITAAKAPYQDPADESNYAFVYDEEVVIVAHPKSTLVGRSYKGKPDVRGKKFRDEIVSGALANGTGWVDYSYQKPGETGIHEKTTYYKLVKGNDQKQYIVCVGMYK